MLKVDIASPHDDDFYIRHPLEIQPGLKGLFMWCVKVSHFMPIAFSAAADAINVLDVG